MSTLPGNYHKTLKSYGIEATPFSRLRGNADSEFNNRSHRKITVIDGKIGYTGGVNIADEYAMIGTINLDYRSLVHHFENGVWMYKCRAVKALKQDIEDTFEKSILITPEMLKINILQKFIRAVVRIFVPML